MNNTMKYFIFLCMVFAMSCSFAQKEEVIQTKFKAVRMYTHSDFRLDKNSSNFVSLLRTFSPSISWGKEYGNFQEVGIQDVQIVLNDFWKSYRSTFNYSYNFRIGRGTNPDKRFKFYAGLGGQGMIDFQKIPAYSSSSYVSKNSAQSFSLMFTPRMTVRLSKNILLDVNMPYGVYSTSRFSYTTDNPHVSVDDRTRVGKETTTFPNQLTVRVGVAIKF